MFHNRGHFYGEELLPPRPTPKLEDHPLSAVCNCLFNIFTANLWGCSKIILKCCGDEDYDFYASHALIASSNPRTLTEPESDFLSHFLYSLSFPLVNPLNLAVHSLTL